LRNSFVNPLVHVSWIVWYGWRSRWSGCVNVSGIRKTRDC